MIKAELTKESDAMICVLKNSYPIISDQILSPGLPPTAGDFSAVAEQNAAVGRIGWEQPNTLQRNTAVKNLPGFPCDARLLLRPRVDCFVNEHFITSFWKFFLL